MLAGGDIDARSQEPPFAEGMLVLQIGPLADIVGGS